jgi:hypothetical protein
LKRVSFSGKSSRLRQATLTPYHDESIDRCIRSQHLTWSICGEFRRKSITKPQAFFVRGIHRRRSRASAPTGARFPVFRTISPSANLAPLGLLAQIRRTPRAGALGYRIPPRWGCPLECRVQKRDTKRPSVRAGF